MRQTPRLKLYKKVRVHGETRKLALELMIVSRLINVVCTLRGVEPH